MFKVFKRTLQKTVESIKTVVAAPREKLEKDIIEEVLITADVDYELVEKIVDELPAQVRRDRLKKELLKPFEGLEISEFEEEPPVPFVEIIIGVNGAGKTTTIAKLAKKYKDSGQSVLLGAGDTFRAAAIEQLRLWAEKLDVPIVYTQQGHDPGAVAFDTISSAKAKNVDRVILDTAGRLHNKQNLQKELEKIVRVSGKALKGAPHRKLLILDGTQGNSAVEQARVFDEILDVDGIIITKLDGTSKGGAVFSVVDDLKLPVLYIGTGESMDDLTPFEPEAYIDSLLDSIYAPDEETLAEEEELIEESVPEEESAEEIVENSDLEEVTETEDALESEEVLAANSDISETVTELELIEQAGPQKEKEVEKEVKPGFFESFFKVSKPEKEIIPFDEQLVENSMNVMFRGSFYEETQAFQATILEEMSVPETAAESMSYEENLVENSMCAAYEGSFFEESEVLQRAISEVCEKEEAEALVRTQAPAKTKTDKEAAEESIPFDTQVVENSMNVAFNGSFFEESQALQQTVQKTLDEKVDSAEEPTADKGSESTGKKEEELTPKEPEIKKKRGFLSKFFGG